jgi:hypothetical protein
MTLIARAGDRAARQVDNVGACSQAIQLPASQLIACKQAPTKTDPPPWIRLRRLEKPKTSLLGLVSLLWPIFWSVAA